MLKNYLKITIKVLKRKKLFSAVTLIGISLPLTLLMLLLIFTSHYIANEPPQSNFGRVLFVDQIKWTIDNGQFKGFSTPPPSYLFIKNHIKTMKSPEMVGVYSPGDPCKVFTENSKSDLKTKYTDGIFWQITDYTFLEGRPFTEKEVNEMKQLAVIDQKTKEQLFNDKNAIGESISLFKKKYKIIGVVKNADITRSRIHANIWLPITTEEKFLSPDVMSNACHAMILAMNKDIFPEITNEYENVIKHFDLGKYPGMVGIESNLDKDDLDYKLSASISTIFSIHMPWHDNPVFPLVFYLVAFFFIVFPAINLLHIHLNRISERLSEIGVRKSFGASKNILSNQFIFENIALTGIGGIIGLTLTFIIILSINKSEIIHGCILAVNPLLLVICLLVWVVFGFVSGYIPAIFMSRHKITHALQSNGNSKNVMKNKWGKIKSNFILIIEFFLTFISLSAIFVVVFFLVNNSKSPLGFNYENVFEIKVKKNNDDMFFSPPQDEFNENIRNEVQNNPEVLVFGKWKDNKPYDRGHKLMLKERISYGNESLNSGEVFISNVDVNMDSVFQLEIIEGRWFEESDYRPDFAPIIIDVGLKDELFGKNKSEGKEIIIKGKEYTIVGVVRTYKFKGEFARRANNIFTLLGAKRISGSSLNTTGLSGFIRVKDGVSEDFGLTQEEKLSKVFPGYKIDFVSLVKKRSKYYKSIWQPLIQISSIFFFIVIIVILGLFGVLWYNISLRSPEIGLRMAVGANKTRIFNLFIGEMLVYAILGIIPGILVVMQFPVLKVFDFETSIYFFAVLASAVVIILLVLVCTLIPGIQATKIQPAIALHED